jgi:hypothetical protein
VRFTAIGLVAFSVLAGCGDRKRDAGGLPPSEEWKAPPTSDAIPAAVESVEETLARCVARTFVDDAARDGNLPADTIDGLADVPAERAVVVLRALAGASTRLPRADQHAMLLAHATLMLIERGVTDTAPAALRRVEVLIERPADHEFRPEIAAAAAARAWGRLADAAAVTRLGDHPARAPYLARGLAEGGHGALADEVLGRIVTLARVEPFAAAELAITELVRGRVDQARKLVAVAPADWRSVHAVLLATAAVERDHPDARAIFAEAAAIVDRDAPRPRMAITMAKLAHAVGDLDGAAARRASLRTDLAANPDRGEVLSTLYGVYALAAEAGATDEAGAVLGDMKARGAAPWMLALARGEGLARTGELQRAVEDVARLPADAAPPRGVVHLLVLVRYLARPQRDPAFEQWLLARVCDG